MRILRFLQTMRHITFGPVGFTGLLILSAVILISCGGQPKDGSPDSAKPELSTTEDSLVIVLAGEDSLSVLRLLQRDHEVVFKSSVMGKFVTAVDSLESSASVYWVYTVNDSSPAVACDRFLTSDGDTVRWHFRKSAP